MGFDDIILRIGEFGPFQRRMILIFSLPAIATSLFKIGELFITATPDFRCLLPHENSENATYQLPLNITTMAYPFDNKTEKWSRCERYDFDFTNEHNAWGGNLSSMPPTVKCDSFVYDKIQTITTEWNLVCDNARLKTLSGSLFMLGVIPGVLIFGKLSDKYGRKTALLLGAIIQVVCGLIVSIVPGFISFLIFRVLVASTTSGIYVVGFVAALEMVAPKSRLKTSVTVHLAYSTGYIVTPFLAYFITNWRILHIAFAIPCLILLAFWRSSSESARWLMNKGRVQEAADILHKACLENGVQLSRDVLDSMLTKDCNESKSDLEKASLFDLLRYPNLRRTSLILFVIWFITSVVYWGISWNTSGLGGNAYVNCIVAGTVEIPAHIFQLFTLDRWGRRLILSGSFFLVALSLLPTYFIPTNMTWLLILLTMVGKFAITTSFGVLYIFSAEQFPTPIRNIGTGACSFFARLGAVAAPQVIYLSKIATYLPLVLFGTASMIAGLLSLLLPETLNRKLPETLEDAEQLGKSNGKTARDVDKSNKLDILEPLNEEKN